MSSSLSSSSSSSSPSPSSPWYHCVCVISFDLSLGPRVEYEYPPSSLSSTECQSVCNLSFPDSHSSELGETIFCFRIRCRQEREENSINEKKKDSFVSTTSSSAFLFGYVCFRQVSDSSNARGFFQKSCVLLSPLPAHSILEKVISLVSHNYHEYGYEAITQLDEQIKMWPSPAPGIRVQLPILGHIIQEQMPNYKQHDIQWYIQQNNNANHSPSLSSSSSYGNVSAGTSPEIMPTPPTRSHTTGTEPSLLQLSSSTVPLDTPSYSRASSQLSQPSHSHLTPLNKVNSLPSPSLFSRESSKFKFNASTPIASSNSSSLAPLSSVTSSSSSLSSGLFQSVNLFQEFGMDQLNNLWYMWELVITGEPILIVSAQPSSCSHIVLGLVSLIHPIQCESDYRPYFTLYDHDFKHFSSLHDLNPSNLPPIILGVTNPFFLKSFHRFPHILCFGDIYNKQFQSIEQQKKDEKLSGGTPVSSPTSSPSFTPLQHPKPHLHSKVTTSYTTDQLDIFAFPTLPSQLYSRSQPLLIPDQTVLKRLLIPKSTATTATSRIQSFYSASKKVLTETMGGGNNKQQIPQSAKSFSSVQSSPLHASHSSGSLSSSFTASSAASSASISDYDSISEINNAILRKTFFDLTTSFLLPLQEYITFPPSSTPSSLFDPSSAGLFTWNPYLSYPEIPKFNESTFLQSILSCPSSSLPTLYPLCNSMKSHRRVKLHELYSKFVRSPHFYPWLNENRQAAESTMDECCYAMIKCLGEAEEQEFLQFLDGIRVSQALIMFKRGHTFLWNIMKKSIQQHKEQGTQREGGTEREKERVVNGTIAPVRLSYDDALYSSINAHMSLIKKVIPTNSQKQFIQVEINEKQRLNQLISQYNQKQQEQYNHATGINTNNNSSNSSPELSSSPSSSIANELSELTISAPIPQRTMKLDFKDNHF